MKAAVYSKQNVVELRDVSVGEVEPNELKVKIEYCALCATDLHVVTQGLYGMPFGTVLGHEASGTIVEMGAATKGLGLNIGDRVACTTVNFCGACSYCKKGLIMHCSNRTRFNSRRFGCLAEYRIFNPQQVFKIPTSLSFEEAALIEPMSCAARAMDLAHMKIGNTVALSGAGGIGLILLQMIKLQGGTRITVIEPVESKRRLALELGADFVIDPLNQDIVEESMKITDNLGYDFVFEASGATVAAPPCLKIVGKLGCVVYFAVYPMDYELPVNLYDLYKNEARIQTVYTSQYVFPRCLDLTSKLDLKKIVGATYKLESVVEAFDVFRESRYPKILIRCS